MINWNISTPQRLISGRGSFAHLPLLLEELGLKAPFMIIDPNVRKKALLKLSSVPFQRFFDDFGTNPTFSQVDNAAFHFRKATYDSIIVIGGGSAIDLAKLVALICTNGGNAEEYFEGRIPKLNSIPTVAIPTTCGTGAESSPFAVIMNPDIPQKRGMESIFFMPKVVVLDPEFLLTLDRIMIAATGIDTFAHLLESHISKKSTVLTRIHTIGLIPSLSVALEKAVMDPNIDSLEIMQAIAFSARLLYPRTGLSIAHALSHPIGAHTGLHHGLAVAMLLPASLEYNYPYCQEILEDVEKSMGLSAGTDLLSWIRMVYLKSGIDREITEYLSKVKSLPIERIAKEALKSSNIPSNPRALNFEDVCLIIEKTLSSFREKYDI